jgi:glutathione synthase/RimK-type ligase-like ATP-grasp enzyme
MPSEILIVSNAQDEHTRCVASKVAALGAEPLLLYPEDLGPSGWFCMALGPSDAWRCQLGLSACSVELGDLQSIWYRRPRPVSLRGVDVSPEGSEFAAEEWRAALAGLYSVAQRPLWVSHPDALEKASRKTLQLAVAQSLGLTVPRTMITNNRTRAEGFLQECPGGAVVKATGRGWVVSGGSEEVAYVLTNRVTAADLAHADDLEMAPVTFQEEIPKAYEIRANVVGQEVLAIRIDSQESKKSELDWRRYDIDRTPYLPYRLPPNVELACLKLTKALGLEFSAIDLIRTPGGDYVFLETNGNGQFLWAEELSGVSVSSALASLLAGRSPSLQSASL